jgi:hypothetical protein
MIIRKIFGPNEKEMKRGWNKLHNGALPNFCSSVNIAERSNQGK